MRIRVLHMPQDIETAIIKAISTQKQLDSNSITADSVLQDLGVSSLDAITIVYEIEEQFGISVPNDQLEGLKTVSDIVSKIEKLIENKSQE